MKGLRALTMWALVVSVMPVQASADRLQRIYEATCRVSVPGGTGTGTVFREDDEHYYILTNAHVVGASRTAGVEFIKDHWPSGRMRATVTGRKLIQGGSFDVAVLRLKKSLKEMNGVKLPVIPLATADDEPAEVRLITCGCQAGEMPSLQQVLTVQNSGQLIYYVPPAKPGRSGSALVDVEGEKIYGLVAWETRANGKSNGLAMTTERILPWLVNRNHAVEVSALPPGTTVIPLAPDVDEETRLMAAAQSCEDPNSPWCPNKPSQPARPDGIGGSDNPWSGGGGSVGRQKPDDVSRRMKVLIDAQTEAQAEQFNGITSAIKESGGEVSAGLADAVTGIGETTVAAKDELAKRVDETASGIHIHLNEIKEKQSAFAEVAGTFGDLWTKVKMWLAAVIALLVVDRVLSAVWSQQWPAKVFGPMLKRVLSIRFEGKAALKARLAELEQQIQEKDE